MTRSYELEALAMKYENPRPCVVKVEIKEGEKDPNWEVSKSWASFGYVKVWGKMTEQQRSKFINHIEKYVELLFKEAESEVAFRKEWDSYE